MKGDRERLPRLRKTNVNQNVKQGQSVPLVFIARAGQDVPELSHRHNDESYLLKPSIHLSLPSLVPRIVREGKLKPCARRHHHQPWFLVMLRFTQKHCLFTLMEAQYCHAIFLLGRIMMLDLRTMRMKSSRMIESLKRCVEMAKYLEHGGGSLALHRLAWLPRWFIRCQDKALTGLVPPKTIPRISEIVPL